MEISFAINVLDLIKGAWCFIKNMYKKEEEKPSSTPNEHMHSEEETRQEQRKSVEKQIMLLSCKNKNLHSLAIRELERIAENPDLREKQKLFICESLCQYLSKHPNSRPAFDALFKRGSIFVSLKKEIKDTNFVKLNLSRFHTIENVNFVNCKFYDCHFHKIHFRNFNMHGGEIHKCDFKDEIRFSECFFKDVHIDDSKFKHVFFTSLNVRGGKFSSSVILRSEFYGVSFINVEMENMAFQFCYFEMEDFSQCQMSDVYFKFKDSEAGNLERMQKYLSYKGYHPCVEQSSMTLITG